MKIMYLIISLLKTFLNGKKNIAKTYVLSKLDKLKDEEKKSYLEWIKEFELFQDI